MMLRTDVARVKLISIICSLTLFGLIDAVAQDTAVTEATQTSVLAEETDDIWPATVVTNTSQLLGQFGRQDLFGFPDGLNLELYTTDGQPWWIDFGKYPWLEKLKESAKDSDCRWLLYPPQYGVEAVRQNLRVLRCKSFGIEEA